MIKILHIIQQLSRGGAGRSMIATAKYSSRMGVVQQHHVVSLLPAEPADVELAMEAEMVVFNKPDRGTILREIENADVVHVHFWNNPEVYELLRSDLPAMRLLLWFKIVGDKPPQIITKELIDYSDFALATSPYTIELPVFQNLPAEVRAKKASIVYGIADFDRLSGLQSGLHNTFNVGYIGTVNFVKMHPNYVPMSAAINIPNVRFIVCGSGGMDNYLRQRAQQLGAAERFDFHGYVEDIKSVIEILDVFGYPLCEDTYATSEKSLQEAMYAGVPPVVFPYGGVKRLVMNNHTGLIVHSELEYKQAIEYLYHHPEERARLGRNAREYAQKTFSAENSTNQINAIYEQLIQLPKRKRQWGIPVGESLLYQPVSLQDLTVESEKFSGAELFDQTLGDAAPHFTVSMTSQNIQELFEAERQIAASSPLLYSSSAGGIFNYRAYYPNDGYLRFWSGLVVQQLDQNAEAVSEFIAAINLGCNHWRVGWYLAQAAEKVNDIALAEKAVRAVVQVAPDFAEAQEMLKRIEKSRSEFISERSPAPVHVENKQRIVRPTLKISLHDSSIKDEAVNQAFLSKQRDFWNVNSMYEAMFSRVFTDETISRMPLQEQINAWNQSAVDSAQKIIQGIPTQPDWKILEIGCGVGRVIKPLRNIFAQVDGVDISENMIHFAKQYLADGKHNGQVHVNNGYDLKELPSENYDFVYSMIVFQHIRSISVVKSYLREIFRVLKPGGYFRIQVHDYHNDPNAGRFDEEAAPEKEYGFSGNSYTDEQLRELLTEHGFDVVSIESESPWIWATVQRHEQEILAKTTSAFKVSAIISTYNSEKFMRGCLQDLTEQTLYKKGELEIIVIDSASEQNEQVIVQEFQARYPNIFYIRTLERETLYAAWNRGIQAARGQYITNANTDDRHRRDALEIMANYLDAHPGTALVYADQLITTVANDSWATTQADKRWNWPPFSYNELERRCIIGPQPMWRKSLHEKYGYFRPEFTSAADYEFWLRIGKTEEIVCLPEILGLYYDNPQSLEHGASTLSQQETYRIWDEYDILRRRVVPTSSVPVPISPSKLNALPYRTVVQPLVSIIIPCYNQAQFLLEAVASVVAQTYSNWEIVIVNDGSPDNTSEIAEQIMKTYLERKIRLIEKENGGCASARNAGIAAANGEYILPLDADDILSSNAISLLIEIALKSPSPCVAFGSHEIFGIEQKRVISADLYSKENIKIDNMLACTSLYPKSVWTLVKGYKEEIKDEGYEDWEFWLNCHKHNFNFCGSREIVLYYRKHYYSRELKSRINRHYFYAQLLRYHLDLFKPTFIIDGVFFQLFSEGIAPLWKSLLEEWVANGFARYVIFLDRDGTAPKIPGIRFRLVPAYNYNSTEADSKMLQQIWEQEQADLFVSTYYTQPLSTPSVFIGYDMISEIMSRDLMAKSISSFLIEATLLPLRLKDINLILFPDWSRPEESLGWELEQVIKALVTHPNKSHMTLLIKTSNIVDEDANLILSGVMMNLLMQEDLDVEAGPEISLFGLLGAMQWEALLPRINARIVLEHENQQAIAQSKAENLPVFYLNNNEPNTLVEFELR